jgi:hypothetical protein
VGKIAKPEEIVLTADGGDFERFLGNVNDIAVRIPIRAIVQGIMPLMLTAMWLSSKPGAIFDYVNYERDRS